MSKTDTPKKRKPSNLQCDGCGRFIPDETNRPDGHVCTDDGRVLCLPCGSREGNAR